MHHVCMLGKHILGCMLWDNPIYLLGLKQEEESKDSQACHAIIIVRLLNCSSYGCTIESPEILSKLLMSWISPQRFCFNWPEVWSSFKAVEVLWVILMDQPAPLHRPRGRQGGREGQQRQRPWVMFSDLLPSMLPMPQGALSHGCRQVSCCSSHSEAGCPWLHPAPTSPDFGGLRFPARRKCRWAQGQGQ